MYKEKYLKYKTKYLELKSQLGSGSNTNTDDDIFSDINKRSKYPLRDIQLKKYEKIKCMTKANQDIEKRKQNNREVSLFKAMYDVLNLFDKEVKDNAFQRVEYWQFEGFSNKNDKNNILNTTNKSINNMLEDGTITMDEFFNKEKVWQLQNRIIIITPTEKFYEANFIFSPNNQIIIPIKSAFIILNANNINEFGLIIDYNKNQIYMIMKYYPMLILEYFIYDLLYKDIFLLYQEEIIEYLEESLKYLKNLSVQQEQKQIYETNINETIKRIENLIKIILKAQKIRRDEAKVVPMKIKQEAENKAANAVVAKEKAIAAKEKALAAQELAIVKAKEAEEAKKIAVKKAIK